MTPDTVPQLRCEDIAIDRTTT